MRTALPADAKLHPQPDEELPEGPWLDTLLGALPELSALPRERAVEMMVADPALLDRAFRRLPAGRLPPEAVARLVRQAAWHLIARRLEPPRSEYSGRFRNWPTVGWHALSDRVSLRRVGLAERQTEAARLYAALKPWLRHGWQVPLLPFYARMTPELAERLGPRLLDLPHADALAAFIDEAAPH